MTDNEIIEIFQSELEWAKQNKYPYVSSRKQEALRKAIMIIKKHSRNKQRKCPICYEYVKNEVKNE